MLTNLYVSLKEVFPLFAMMAIGYLVKNMGMVDKPALKKMNAMCFNVFMAFMMFNNVYTLDLQSAFSPKLMLYMIGGMLFLTFAGVLLVTRYEPDNSRRGVLIQAVYRGNFVVLGFPLVSSLYGADSLAIPTLMISIVVPYMNVMSVVLLTYYSGNRRPGLWLYLKEVVTNPYIVAAALGFICLGFHITLPDMVYSVVKDMAAVANPLALVILGASFTFENVAKYRRELVFSCSLKLLIFPAILIIIGILLGFREIELMTAVACFATPTAIASHAMAQQLGGDADLAGVNVVICTALSVITLFLWIFVLKTFGLL